MATGQPPPQIGTDTTVLMVVLLLAGLPFVFVVYKICAGLRVEEPRKKKKTKKEQAEEADDPMAWFAGKLNDMAVAREEAKAAQSQEAKGPTPEDLWNMLDANKDGIVDIVDLQTFLKDFDGEVDANTVRVDFDCDGQETIADFRLFVSYFGTAGPECN